MTFLHSQTGPQLRAAMVLLVLLVGTCAPAVKLVLPTPVTCGMACCEANGACYCADDHGAEAVLDRNAAHNDVPFATLDVAKLRPGCPSQCAQLPVSNQRPANGKTLPPRFAFVICTVPQSYICKLQIAFDTVISGLYAPRAPPSLS